MRGWLTVVVSLLALILAAEDLDAKPESRRNGRIIFIVGESGDIAPSPRLVVMDANGASPRVRLGYVYDASLSPDGRLITYDPAASHDTRMINADGPLRDRLVVRNGRGADWSPTGTAIAFVRGGDIWVKDLRGRTQRRVVRHVGAPELGAKLDWSPAGKKLAFGRGDDVWVADLASKRTKRLVRNAGNARWSPDGRRIAYERGDPGQIYVARADGTHEVRVAKGEYPAWSPDGRELAFTDGKRIIRLRLEGRHRRVVYTARYFQACRFLDWAR
jgi:Tol biopolymer transport system component